MQLPWSPLSSRPRTRPSEEATARTLGWCSIPTKASTRTGRSAPVPAAIGYRLSSSPVLIAAAEALGELSDERAELHLYGSVATGMARLGVSDVDLLAIWVPEGWARDIGAALSGRFGDLCRGLELGQAQPADFRGECDAAYGNRVFLHHYCVPGLTGTSRSA